MVRLVINGTCLEPKPSGLGVYTYEVASRLLTLFPGSLLILNNGNRLSRPPTSFPVRRPLSERLLRNTISVPLVAKRTMGSILFSPTQLDTGFSFGAPHVVVVHDITPLIVHKAHGKQFYWYKYLLPRILNRASHIIADSHNTKNDIINLGITPPISVVYPGINHQHFFPRNQEAIATIKKKYRLSEYFLYVGNMFPHKNLSAVIRAHNASRIDSDLVLVGQKDDRFINDLHHEIRRHNFPSRVKILDYVPHNDIPALMSGAIAFIYVSLYEGFGLPVLEAMACGAPVITSNTSSLHEISNGAAVLVNPCSTDDIANAMSKVYNSKQIRVQLSEGGPTHAKDFSWDNTAAALQHIFLDLK